MYLPLMIDRPVVFPAKAEYFAARGPLGRLWAAYLRSTKQLEMDWGGARSAQATLEAAVELLRAGSFSGSTQRAPGRRTVGSTEAGPGSAGWR
jgi:1-acyl-sn-glycerol-3-phosphate acyltransferase